MQINFEQKCKNLTAHSQPNAAQRWFLYAEDGEPGSCLFMEIPQTTRS